MTVLSLIASVLLIIGLAMTPHSPANTNKRLGKAIRVADDAF